MKIATGFLLCSVFFCMNSHAADDGVEIAECLVNPDDAHCNIAPIEFEPPMYPARASSRGISGWAKMSFTITAEGTVTDVIIIDAEPRGMFDSSSIRAIEKFRFAPRLVDGTAVPVNNVQHVFRFDI